MDIHNTTNLNNVTLKCDETQTITQVKLFDLYDMYKSKEKEQLMAYKLVAYILGTLIILSNLTVVISSGLILKKGQQPKSTYLLLGNVSLADTIVGMSIIFGAIVDHNISSFCVFQIGMLVCPAMVSIFSVGLIAVDRYIYIVHGLYYQRWFNTTKVRIGILCIWMIGIILGFMPATGWVNTEARAIFISSLPAMGWTGKTFRDYRCWYISLFPSWLLIIVSVLVLSVIVMVCVLYILILHSAVKTVDKIREYRETNSIAYINKAYEQCDENSSTNTRMKVTITISKNMTTEKEGGTAIEMRRHDKYEGHQVYRIGSTSEELGYLQGQLDILSTIPATRSTSGHLEAVVRLSAEEKQQWLGYFENKGIPYTKIIDNLADILREEDAKIAKSRLFTKPFIRKTGEDESSENDNDNENSSSSNNESESSEEASSVSSSQENSSSEEGDGSEEEGGSQEGDGNDLTWDNLRWDTYYRHNEINAFIDDLGAKYPNLVTVINAALSFEGRQIKYVRISTTRFENLRKPVIIIDAMMHAREWLTTPVAMYIINQLVVDIVDSELVDLIDWVIIPLANPDGYEYSIDEDRMWRKTRSTNHEGADACPGVDGNRNFDHYWGTTPNTANPCTIIYQGPAPFSEPEVRVVRDVVMQQLDRAAMYISVHTYGNMFLYAWGNNGTLPSNAFALHLAGIRMAEAIDELALDKAKRYVVGNAAQILSMNTGTSRDWTRAVGIPLTYTLELPGYEYDFIVPPEYVPQVVKETWAGIAEGARYVISLYYN
ncbi:zinc carboxypeptidase domain-containing protein [Phthorimaea operculella]|nr:zinc carboxypeptidase domain-containing protein [Phthorimaea operculella]